MVPTETLSRPRPPAKVRRSASASLAYKSGASPPPPYASSKYSFPRQDKTESSDEATQQPSRDVFDEDGQSTSDWFNEKSREELSDLLVKADGLIKERETELGIASAAVKALHDSNVTLKSQHQTLLARIPGSPTFTGNNATLSPFSTLTPSVTNTPHFYSDSLPRNRHHLPQELFDSPSYAYPQRHARKVSVSQHDLSLLADQNAELSQKLERLEADSAKADRAGRKVLKRLERELASLKDELEQTQARSNDLEEKARSGMFSTLTEEELYRRKAEREARTKALRSSTSSEGFEEVKDFAPANPLFTSSPPRARSIRSSMSMDSLFDRASDFSSPIRPLSITDLNQVLEQEEVFSPAATGLIQQLIAKMHELEDTNAQIMSHQAETTRQLQDVQKEAEGMSRLYDCLNDQNGLFELEMVNEASSNPTTPEKIVDDSQADAQDTIRFRSLRKTLESDMAKVLASESRESEAVNAVSGSSFQKPRKSVIDLFELPKPTKQSTPPVPFAPSSADDHYDPPLSPALSTLSMTSATHTRDNTHRSIDAQLFPDAPSPFNSSSPLPRGSTLESELGSDWTSASGVGNHYHLRTTSLYSVSSALQSMPSSPSPQPIAGPSSNSLLMAIEASDQLPGTPSGGPRLALEPPTPERHSATTTPKAHRTKQNQPPIPQTPQTIRYHKLSETVRARTSQWANGRFDGSLTSLFSQKDEKHEAEDEKLDAKKPKTTLPPVLENAIEVVLEKFTNMAGNTAGVSEPVPSSLFHSTYLNAEKKKPAAEPSSSAKLILEVWLWLQFIIIILIFVGAMFHRGPRSVLSDVRGKRAVERR
ncbi:hypothetical protein DL96DRAFT_1703742 [Flagelloscypha sp. PMI_526]|nr:hypothetical protein DL96DRAFT_1703742 [Flagelloscypha sp. PMI_526]